jgi:hypothetical protein
MTAVFVGVKKNGGMERPTVKASGKITVRTLMVFHPIVEECNRSDGAATEAQSLAGRARGGNDVLVSAPQVR